MYNTMKNIILIISSIIRPIISLQQITPQINPLINQKICITPTGKKNETKHSYDLYIL